MQQEPALARRLKAPDAARYLGCSVRTLYNLPIRRIKIGKATVWDTHELDIYMGLHSEGVTIARTA